MAVCGLALALFGGILEDATAQSAPETRTIGAIVPHNWDLSSQILGAIEMAVYDFNRNSDERGWVLEVVIADSESSAAKTLEIMQQFNSNGIKAVVGPAYSSVLSHVSDYVNDNQIVTVSYASGATSLSNPDDYIFRTLSDASTHVDPNLALFERDQITNVVMISVDDTVGVSIKEAVEEGVGRTDNVNMLASISMALAGNNPDYDGVISQLSDALSNLPAAEYSQTAIVLFDHSGGILDVARAAAGLPGISDTKWYGPDHSRASIEQDAEVAAFLESVNYQTVEVAAVENHLSVCIDASVNTGQPGTNSYAYQAYNAIFILGDVIDKVGSATDSGAIQNDMTAASERMTASMSALGVSGAFNENGDLAASDYAIYDLVDGKFVVSGQYVSSSNRIDDRIAYDDRRKIGALVSETGLLSVVGHPAGKAICLAVADYNERLRDSGESWQLELVTYDDGTNPANTIAGLAEFNRDGIKAVLGPSSSFGLEAIQDDVAANNMVVVSYSSASPSLEIENDNIFRMRASDTNAIPVYLKMLERDRITDVVIIYRDDAWGQIINNELTRNISQTDGMGILSSEPYDPLVRQPSDLVALSDRVGDMIAALPDDRRVGVMIFGYLEIEIIFNRASTDPSLQDTMWYGYENSLVELDASLHGWMENVMFKSLESAYTPNSVNRMIDGILPHTNIFSYFAYDSTFVLANAIGDASRSTNAGAIAALVPAAAASINPSALGVPLNLNAAGDLSAVDYDVRIFRDGSFVEDCMYSSDIGSLQCAVARSCR